MVTKPVQKTVEPVRHHPVAYPDYVLLFPEAFMPENVHVVMNGQLCGPTSFRFSENEGMPGRLHLLASSAETRNALNNEPTTVWMAFISPDQEAP